MRMRANAGRSAVDIALAGENTLPPKGSTLATTYGNKGKRCSRAGKS